MMNYASVKESLLRILVFVRNIIFLSLWEFVPVAIKNSKIRKDDQADSKRIKSARSVHSVRSG